MLKETGGVPGDLLYTANITSEASTDSWTRHRLSTPINVPDDGLWITVRIEHPETFGSVGCDEGSANSNGDLMFVESTNTWTNLRSFTNGQTDVNWNIRGVVGE